MLTIKPNNALLLIVDVQEKLVNMLTDSRVKDNAVIVAKACGKLDIPCVITEQYPKGLGQTIEEIKTALPDAAYFEKKSFSAMLTDGFEDLLQKYNKKQIIIMGIETHICVLQTAFDLLENRYDVFVVENACGSRNADDKKSALKRLSFAHAQVLTTEMVLFELLTTSQNPKFKEVQALIK